MTEKENPAVTNFRNYIKIKTEQPQPDYASSTKYLEGQAKEIDAQCEVMETVPGRPVVIMTILGKDPSLPSLLLNSHTDVVPVYPEHWKYDPFSAHKEENGDIYGRGTQDMKSVGVQYLEALKRLKKQGEKFLRTVHLTFVPDEEINEDGMGKFVQTEFFKRMNVGFALDEGYSSTDETFHVFYGERIHMGVMIECPGQPGHASQILPNTAGEKLRKILNSFLGFRESELRRLNEDPKLKLGDVSTVNLTLLQGGVQFNVVPAAITVGIDIRSPPTIDVIKFEERIAGWCQEAGQDVTYKFPTRKWCRNITCVEDGKNPWWDAFSGACRKAKIKIEAEIFPAGTDARHLRILGIPALGFSPINETPRLLHDHNEYLNEKVFLKGIDIYATIIPALANIPKF